jgi:hypothetical protein
MNPTRIKNLYWLLLFGLTACTSPPTATLPPSPQPVRVVISPFLEPVREALHVCALSLPEIALFVDVVPQNSLKFNASDIVIWWGDKPGEVDLAYQIAEERLIVIVNLDNKNTQMSTSELQGLFNGRIEHWTEISILDEDVAVWIFPEASFPSELFNLTLLGVQKYSRLAHIAPSPGPMLAEVRDEPGAIGFIPRTWLSAEVAQVDIEPELQTALNRPILALVNSEPTSGIRNLLACLQSGDGQEILAARYSLDISR